MKIYLFILLFPFCVNAQQAKKIYASSMFASGPAYDNSAKLKALIKNAPNKSTIIFPNGDYYFTTADTIFNKALTLQGAENTNFYFKNGSNGLVLIPGPVIQTCTINDINIFGQGLRQGTNGNGIVCHTVTNIKNVFIKNFGGYGISITADINSGSNASFSKIESVEVAECGGGFYVAGGDANQIEFNHCDARDNDGLGFWDHSFLGCQFYNCMAHANKGGHYKADDPNNRAGFFSCYGEGDSPANILCGNAIYVGGLNASSFELHDRAITIAGAYFSSANFGNNIKLDESGIIFPQSESGSFPLVLKRINSPFPHIAFNHYYGDNLFEVWGASPGIGTTDYAGRQITFSSAGLKSVFIGSKLFMEAKPTDPRFIGFSFKYGDTLLNPDYDGEGIRQWVYKKTGWEAQN